VIGEPSVRERPARFEPEHPRYHPTRPISSWRGESGNACRPAGNDLARSQEGWARCEPVERRGAVQALPKPREHHKVSVKAGAHRRAPAGTRVRSCARRRDARRPEPGSRALLPAPRAV
jgi:hypothetical protein